MGATLRCGAQSSRCGGFVCCRARALGARASVVVVHRLSSCGSRALERRLSCSAACGIFSDQGSNPCPLHWQADSFFFFLILFIYFWLRCIFVAAHGHSLVAASGGYSFLRCVGFSLWCLLLLRITGSRHVGFSSCGTWASVVVARGLSSCGSRA